MRPRLWPRRQLQRACAENRAPSCTQLGAGASVTFDCLLNDGWVVDLCGSIALRYPKCAFQRQPNWKIGSNAAPPRAQTKTGGRASGSLGCDAATRLLFLKRFLAFAADD